MQNIRIRQEASDDQYQINIVNQTAFGREDEARLVDALRKNKRAFLPELSLVAIIEERIAGHILFTEIMIENEKQETFKSLALAPIAVLPEYQRAGIGGALIRKGIEKATQLGYHSIIVLGHENYYPKFGFAPAIQWNIKAPFEVPETNFMAMELVQDGLSGVSGTVQYPKEFSSVE